MLLGAGSARRTTASRYFRKRGYMVKDKNKPGEKLTFSVNGNSFKSKDQIMTGRDILQVTGFIPASEHVLIMLTDPGTRSIGLDEKVDFTNQGNEVFRAFASDRIFNFTVDELGYEWGEPIITEAQLREVTGADEDDVFVLDQSGEADKILEEGDSVDLSVKGTEHIRTKKRITQIIVNAREHKVQGIRISYNQVVALAFNPVPTGPDVLFTVTYRKGPLQNPKGTLPEGQSVFIKNGMIFNVTQTNRS